MLFSQNVGEIDPKTAKTKAGSKKGLLLLLQLLLSLLLLGWVEKADAGTQKVCEYESNYFNLKHIERSFYRVS